MRPAVSGALRHSILGQVGVFAIVGPPLGGLLGLVLLTQFDLLTALLIGAWSYGLVLPVIACAAAGWLCVRASVPGGTVGAGPTCWSTLASVR